MNTVKIFKTECTKGFSIWEQGKGASLQGYGKNTVYYEGSDDGGKNYLLPDGCTLGVTVDGQPAIFDENDCYCNIVNNNDQIILVSPAGMIELAEV